MQGFVTVLALEFFNPEQDHDTNLFARPRELTVDWRTIDTLVSQFSTNAPNPWALEMRMGTNSVDSMRAFVPYVSSQMPLMQTRLVFQFGHTDSFDLAHWIPWGEELEHVEDLEDGVNGETGATETALVD